MRNLILLALLMTSLEAKEYFIQIKNVKYTLEVIPQIHGIATDAFVDLKNIGKSDVVDTSVDKITTNFEFFQTSDEEKLVTTVDFKAEVFNSEEFFKCLKDVERFLFVKKVRKATTIEDTLVQSFLTKKRGLNNGLCSAHLGERFYLVDDDSLLMLIQISKALDAIEFDKFFSMFIKSKMKTEDMNEYLAREMIISEAAFDILLNKKDMVNFDFYKERIINEVKSSKALFQEKYESSNVDFEVKATVDSLVQTIEGLK